MSASGSGDLVLLTARYPYDDAEVVLDPEVAVLAERFGRVFILPSYRGVKVRRLPPNVTVMELPWFGQWPRSAKLRALASRPALRVLAATLRRSSNWRPYQAKWRFYADLLAINVLKARVLRRFVVEEGLERAIFYDYWFENSTLALALLRQEKLIERAASRAHNFDIYDEDWEGRVPFTEFKARWLDRIFPVSEHGGRYLRKRLALSPSKTPVAHLGVEAREASMRSSAKVPLVVSCARLEPRKRIHLIPEVLSRVGRPLRWIHFGDGVERARVEAAAAHLPDAVEWDLRGQLYNQEVLDFYRRHPVDVLLSVSISEGLPVSMMEAQSFGIPIVATAIRGVPELVTEETGVLLGADADTDEIAAGLSRALEPGRFDRARILAFFHDHFEARRNYGEFADALLELAERR
jgi:glycosyltransferase involved in cell wall biosynthesis